MSRVVAIFGGRSEIGLEIARRMAPGNTVVLASRPAGNRSAVPVETTAGSVEPVETTAGSVEPVETTARSVEPVETNDLGASRLVQVDFDADEVATHEAVVERIEAECGPIDVAVLTFGVLGDQARAESDASEVVRILHTDFVAQASLLTVLAGRMRERGAGCLVAFSSVAGQRVRRANYVYGSAKAGLDGFASGLADALHGSGVDLVIARPGFVIGRMTAGMSPAPFSSTPAQVAQAVVDRIASGGAPELWIPWQLRAMFSVAPFVPRALWRRLPR